MAFSKRRYNKVSTSQDAPARPPVSRATVPLKMMGERHHVFTARVEDAGLVSWHAHEETLLEQTIAAKVAKENQFISQHSKT